MQAVVEFLLWLLLLAVGLWLGLSLRFVFSGLWLFSVSFACLILLDCGLLYLGCCFRWLDATWWVSLILLIDFFLPCLLCCGLCFNLDWFELMAGLLGVWFWCLPLNSFCIVGLCLLLLFVLLLVYFEILGVFLYCPPVGFVCLHCLFYLAVLFL